MDANTKTRKYEVTLSVRMNQHVTVEVEAPNQVEAKKAAKAQYPAWKIGQYGGMAYTGVYVTRTA